MAWARPIHGSSCTCCPPKGAKDNVSSTPKDEAADPSYSPVGSSPEINEPRHHFHPQSLTGTPYTIDHLFTANETWSSDNAEWFEQHGHKNHAPEYLWIGCSDARVPANQMIGQDPGKVFVHRNIANLVVSSDMNLRSVLQYAVNVLRVPHIIVCGHYDCGGIRAAMDSRGNARALGSPLEDWLGNIRDVCRLHKDELDAITDAEAKHRRLVELNVIEQCLNIFKTGVVQRRRLLTSQVTGAYPQPRVHGVVYNPRDGTITKLEEDFRKTRKEHAHIYDIYTRQDLVF